MRPTARTRPSFYLDSIVPSGFSCSLFSFPSQSHIECTLTFLSIQNNPVVLVLSIYIRPPRRPPLRPELMVQIPVHTLCRRRHLIPVPVPSFIHNSGLLRARAPSTRSFNHTCLRHLFIGGNVFFGLFY
jgi:hypothetical protein